MTARCPQCQTRYRVDRARLSSQGAQLRCTRCKTVFRVEVRDDPEATGTSEGQVDPVFTPRAHALVADLDRVVARRIADALAKHHIDAQLCHDGAEALLRIFRTRPPLAILGAGLPGVSSPAIAELVRRTSELSRVRLIRVASSEEPAGPPEFDADETVDAAGLTSSLPRMLERLGVATGAASLPRGPVAPVSSVGPVAPAHRATDTAAARAPVERSVQPKPSAARPGRREPPARSERPPRSAPPQRDVRPSSPEPRPRSERPERAAPPRGGASGRPPVEAPRSPAPRPSPPPRAERPERPSPERSRPEPSRATPPPRAAAPAGSQNGAAQSPEVDSPEVQSARRLARIAVSDIILYNEDRFQKAVAAGSLPGALERELAEARDLFKQRVPEALRAKHDFLVEELMRRAAGLSG